MGESGRDVEGNVGKRRFQNSSKLHRVGVNI